MTMRRAFLLLFACVALLACSDDGGGGDAAEPDARPADTRTGDAAEAETAEEEPRVGYEILQVRSPTEIIVWISVDLTTEEFEAIELPQGWIRNQPREGEPDASSFARSPDATSDGEFTYEEHFGHEWMHNATVIEANTPVDDEGLLRMSRVAKFHDVTFAAGRTLYVLVSPEGTPYVRISRDAGRTSEEPTLPDGWRLLEHALSEELTMQLPNPTDNIRGDNEDSFQGPVAELAGVGG